MAHDIDLVAAWIAERHARINDAPIEAETRDRLAQDPADLEFDVVRVGDLFYSSELAGRLTGWLQRARTQGATVLSPSGRSTRCGIAPAERIAEFLGETRSEGRGRLGGRCLS